MLQAVSLFLLLSPLAIGGADPDRYRSVPEGEEVYTGEDITVGQTYQAFLIQFKDRTAVYLSPSRFRVSYLSDALKCRNADHFVLDEENQGQWHTVSFEVIAVKETAIESPPSSGNWIWQHIIDCTIKSLSLSE
jgi:hypothetical protein